MKKLLLIILPLILFFGCNKDDDENNITYQTYQGRWYGSGVSFNVSADNIITSFSATINFASYSALREVTPNAKITNDSFCFTLDKDGIQTQVNGNFTSNEKISGTFGTINYSIISGSSLIVGSSGGYSWSATKQNNNLETVTDYDGNIYNTVKIGDQWWMAENLKTTHYADGTPLVDGTLAGDITGNYTTKYYFWNNNDSANYTETYGTLYTWAAAMNGQSSSNNNPSEVQGVCPAGWHLPSDVEWEKLAVYISNDNGGYAQYDDDWLNVGGHLKATSGWGSDGDGNGTDDYGFSGLPGGLRPDYGSFVGGIGHYGTWWPSTESYNSSAYGRGLMDEHSGFDRSNYLKSYGFSVRCVRD
ncbi:MAG: hypothetical protein KAT68_00440 [Bacteroidales bacterium]|nr:hypothetical protein [Bacteroidales bacterium]